jgi:glycosyltransferase involved in cell wall biosynthesis
MAIVVRAHNEEETIEKVVASLKEVNETVWVAASDCTDETVIHAESAGAKILVTPLGLGASTCEVLQFFVSEPIVFVDGDLADVRTDVVRLLYAAAGSGFVGKGAMSHAGRSSSKLPEMAKEVGVVLPDIPPQALTSAYSSYPAGFADTVDLSLVPQDRGSDLTLSLLSYHSGFDTVVIPAGPREHRDRGEAHIENLVQANRFALKIFADNFFKVQPEC